MGEVENRLAQLSGDRAERMERMILALLEAEAQFEIARRETLREAYSGFAGDNPFTDAEAK